MLLLLSFPLCHTSGRLVAPPLNPTAEEWLIEELRAPASPEHSSPSMLDLGRWVVFDYGPLVKARGFPESTNQLWALPHQALTPLRRFRVKRSELSSHRKLSIDLLPETWQILVISSCTHNSVCCIWVMPKKWGQPYQERVWPPEFEEFACRVHI